MRARQSKVEKSRNPLFLHIGAGDLLDDVEDRMMLMNKSDSVVEGN